MFKHRPVNEASHLTVSISVFRSHKYCASCNNKFCVLFGLIVHPALITNWLLYDVPLIMHTDENAYLGLLFLNALFPPLDLSYITTPGPLSNDDLSRSWQNCPCIGFLFIPSTFCFFNVGLQLILGILENSFLCHIQV